MPELPEVETIRRQLAPHMEGRVLEELEILDPRWCRPAHPSELADAVRGRCIERVARRGKYLLVELAGGAQPDRPREERSPIVDRASTGRTSSAGEHRTDALRDEVTLVMHLRMTGTLLLVAHADDHPGRPHLRARLTLDDGQRVLFSDPRRFGTGEVLLGAATVEDYFGSRLGIEPLSSDFTADALRALARDRRAPVKAFLLTQERVAGVGNIYADEALFRARIHPLRPVGTLRGGQIASLRDAVVESLEAGIDARGATIDDFRHADGARGSFQDLFLVHRREGEPCPRCGSPIRKLRAAGRGTYVCPRCQPRPRAPRTASARPRKM